MTRLIHTNLKDTSLYQIYTYTMTTTITKNTKLRSGRIIGNLLTFPDEYERINEQTNITNVAKQINKELDNEYAIERTSILSEVDKEYTAKRERILSELDNKYTAKRERNLSMMHDNNRQLDQHYRPKYNNYISENLKNSEIMKRRSNFTFGSSRIIIGTPLTYNGHTCYVHDDKNKVCMNSENGILILSATDAAKRVNPAAQSGTYTWRLNGVLLKDLPIY